MRCLLPGRDQGRIHPRIARAATCPNREYGRKKGDPPLDLTGSLLPEARLGWARLAGADLRGADLRATSLQHAELAGAHLEQSLLCGTQLQGADLAGAHLAGARASTATSWPDGFDWRAAGARLVDSC